MGLIQEVKSFSKRDEKIQHAFFSCLQKLFIPFTWNIKNIPSVHPSSTFYLKLSHNSINLSPIYVSLDTTTTNVMSVVPPIKNGS